VGYNQQKARNATALPWVTVWVIAEKEGVNVNE
jgi:hypothetical protein